MQSLIFSKNAGGESFNIEIEDIKASFTDNNLDFEKLVGNDFDTFSGTSVSRICKMVLSKMILGKMISTNG